MTSVPRLSQSCVDEIGISVGVVILVVIIIAMVTIIIALLCWWRYGFNSTIIINFLNGINIFNRKRSSYKSKDVRDRDLVLTTAVVSTGGGDVYEDPDSVVQRIGQGNYELTECPAYGTGQSVTKDETMQQQPLPMDNEGHLLYKN